jgi:hypothetical protein
MKIKTKLSEKNEMLAMYSSCVVAFVFFVLWVFTDIKPTDLFVYFIFCYCVVVLVSFFYPFKK